jgi:hypothetical protein
MKPLSQLRAKIMTRGKFKRGALSRAAEHLELTRTTVRNWFIAPKGSVKWVPGKATLARIEEIVASGKVTFEPRKPGPKGPRR